MTTQEKSNASSEELVYQADSWDRERRMVAKVEVSERGFNRRFVVTNRRKLKKAFKKVDFQRLFIHALAYVAQPGESGLVASGCTWHRHPEQKLFALLMHRLCPT